MVSWEIRHTWMWGISACGVTVHVGWLPRTRCLLTPRQLNAFCFSAPGPHSMLNARMPFPGGKWMIFNTKTLNGVRGRTRTLNGVRGARSRSSTLDGVRGLRKYDILAIAWEKVEEITNEWQFTCVYFVYRENKMFFFPTYFLSIYFVEKNWEFSLKIVDFQGRF